MADGLTRPTARPVDLGGASPLDIARSLQHLPGLVFFDTAGHRPLSSRTPISIIAARPRSILRGDIQTAADRQLLRHTLATAPQILGDHGFPLGALCGWVDYEGQFIFGDYPEMLIHLHEDGSWWETGHLSENLTHNHPPDAPIGPFTATWERQRFIDGVQRIKDWISAGDIYQVNLSQAFHANVGTGSLFSLYQSLRDASPAPMSAWLSLDGREILSSSPESFLKISGRGIETRPIKGTRPRFPDPDEDLRSAYELQTSAKEIAELVMITDLLRNDLGRVCEFGSVRVEEMLHLETLAQVHHLVSTVTGTLRSNIDAIDALAESFPGGSITGAPKLRAMEIIHDIEQTPRGIYCGAIGWLGYNGESSFNIAIRTLIRQNDRLIYQVGAGIVADSDPEKEYDETLHKAAGIRLALERWSRRPVF